MDEWTAYEKQRLAALADPSHWQFETRYFRTVRRLVDWLGGIQIFGWVMCQALYDAQQIDHTGLTWPGLSENTRRGYEAAALTVIEATPELTTREVVLSFTAAAAGVDGDATWTWMLPTARAAWDKAVEAVREAYGEALAALDRS